MPYIPFQPRPKVPPIGFFEPISVAPKDMMTDVEYLLGILKKLNSMIAQINSNTKFIDEYDGKIAEIEATILQLREEMTTFEEQINSEITKEFAEIKIELQGMIAMTLTQANAYSDSIAERLEQEIQEISVGQINVFDPTTGTNAPLQTVINNLYTSSRNDALTATEYDDFELTATQYDGFEITATLYDRSGKSVITGLLSA